jgi:hypothetical protein
MPITSLGFSTILHMYFTNEVAQSLLAKTTTALQQMKPFRFLDLPAELRLMVYEYCAEPETKHHTVIMRREPEPIKLTIILKSTNVQLLATNRLINKEANAIFRRQITHILQSPARFFTSAGLKQAPISTSEIVTGLVMRISDAAIDTRAGRRAQPLRMSIGSRNSTNSYSDAEEAAFGRLIMHAALRHSKYPDCTSVMEIGMCCDSRFWSSFYGMQSVRWILDIVAHRLKTRYGVNAVSRVLVSMSNCRDLEEESNLAIKVRGSITSPFRAPLVDVVVERKEYAEEWV